MTFCGKVESWKLVASVLEHVIAKLEESRANMSEAQRQPIIPSLFDSSRVPEITIYDYLARIHQYAECSESCYTLAFIYIDRVLMMNPGFTLTMRNIHRLILASVVLAIKFSDDIFAVNGSCAKIGGVSLIELNHLEVGMLNLLRCTLFVNQDVYLQYLNELQNRVVQINAERVHQEKIVMESQEKNSKKVNPAPSIASIKTSVSANDMEMS